jgi:hypothetical protein
MDTKPGDVIIYKKTGVSVVSVHVVLDDGDQVSTQPELAVFAEAVERARKITSVTKGRVLVNEDGQWLF